MVGRPDVKPVDLSTVEKRAEYRSRWHAEERASVPKDGYHRDSKCGVTEISEST